MNTHRPMLAVVALVASTCWTAQAAIVVDNSDAGFTGAGWSLVGTGLHVNDDIHLNDAPTAEAAWSPGVAGIYNVQVQWMSHGTHASAAEYYIDADGDLSTTADQALLATANQHFSSNQTSGIDGAASGWYSIGTVTMGTSSRIVVKNGGSGRLIADAVRFSTNDWIVDKRSSATTFNGSWFGPVDILGPDRDSSQYFHNGGNGSTAEYALGQYAGLRDVSVSWAMHPDHAVAARYLLDLDGNLATTNDQSEFIIDQRMLPDQVTLGNAQNWSGWYGLGQYNLSADSKLFLSSLSTGALTADNLLISNIIPEPASIGLALVGGMLLLRRRR